MTEPDTPRRSQLQGMNPVNRGIWIVECQSGNVKRGFKNESGVKVGRAVTGAERKDDDLVS